MLVNKHTTKFNLQQHKLATKTNESKIKSCRGQIDESAPLQFYTFLYFVCQLFLQQINTLQFYK